MCEAPYYLIKICKLDLFYSSKKIVFKSDEETLMSTYLWYRVYSVNLANQFTVRLKKQQQLKVELVESLTKLQLLKTNIHKINTKVLRIVLRVIQNSSSIEDKTNH